MNIRCVFHCATCGLLLSACVCPILRREEDSPHIHSESVPPIRTLKLGITAATTTTPSPTIISVDPA
jgi:hypothetical protein